MKTKKEFTRNIKQFLQFSAMYAVVACLATVMTTAHAQDHVGNGGVSINGGNGERILRDLQDNAVCTWLKGEDFLNQLGPRNILLDFKNIKDDLIHSFEKEENQNARIDILYLDFILNQIYYDLKNVNWCLTDAPLFKVPVEDSDSIIMGYNEKQYQIAVRINNDIFLDKNEFNELSPESQKFLPFHESLHPFISSLNRHNLNVRSSVKIFKSYLSGKTDAQELLFNLKKNSVEQVIQFEEEAFRDTIITFIKHSLILEEASELLEERLKSKSSNLKFRPFTKLSGLNQFNFLVSNIPLNDFMDWIQVKNKHKRRDTSLPILGVSYYSLNDWLDSLDQVMLEKVKSELSIQNRLHFGLMDNDPWTADQNGSIKYFLNKVYGDEKVTLEEMTDLIETNRTFKRILKVGNISFFHLNPNLRPLLTKYLKPSLKPQLAKDLGEGFIQGIKYFQMNKEMISAHNIQGVACHHYPLTPSDLKKMGFNIQEICDAQRMSSRDLVKAGFSCMEIKSIGKPTFLTGCK